MSRDLSGLIRGQDYANICSLSWHGQKTKDIFWVTHIQTQTIDQSSEPLTRFLVLSFSVWINEDEPQNLCIG